MFEVLIPVTMKIFVFWNVVVCSVVDIYQYFGFTCCLHLQGRKAPSTLKMDAEVC
jgi:hypothetical protein